MSNEFELVGITGLVRKMGSSWCSPAAENLAQSRVAKSIRPDE